MNYIIRELKSDEVHHLDDFIYEAIFIPDGAMPPSKDIIKLPEVEIYISDFGKKKDDRCLVAVTEGY